MLKNPRKASLGRQNHRCSCQLVSGSVSGVHRRPISITATRYPFSVNRCALTLPPNPEPTTTKSKSKVSVINNLQNVGTGFQARPRKRASTPVCSPSLCALCCILLRLLHPDACFDDFIPKMETL